MPAGQQETAPRVGEIHVHVIVVLHAAQVLKRLPAIGGVIHAGAVVDAALPKNAGVLRVIQKARRPVDDGVGTIALSQRRPVNAAIRGLPQPALRDAGDDPVLPGHDRQQTQVAALRRHVGEVPGDVHPLRREWGNDAEQNTCGQKTANETLMLGHASDAGSGSHPRQSYAAGLQPMRWSRPPTAGSRNASIPPSTLNLQLSTLFPLAPLRFPATLPRQGS